MPVIIPFFMGNGLSMEQVMILQSIMAVSIVVMEVPSGYVGDVLGRKSSLIIGCTFGFLGFAVMSFAHTFWQFAITEFLLGIGASFVSGSDSAMLYDSLLANNREKEFVKYQGRLSSLGNFSESAAGILGGLLAALSIRYPIYLQTFLLFFSILIAFSLKEPKRLKLSAADTKKNMKRIGEFLKNHPKVKWWLLFGGIVGAGTLTTAWVTQYYFKALEIDIKWFGFLWTAVNLTVGIGSYFSHKIRIFVPINVLMLVALIIVMLAPAAAGYVFSLWGIGFFFAVYFMRGIVEPIFTDYINRYTASEMRATVLSVRSFIFRALFAIFGPYVGWLLDRISIGEALFLSLMMLFILGIGAYVMLKQVNAFVAD